MDMTGSWLMAVWTLPSYSELVFLAKPTSFGTVTLQGVCPKLGGRILELVARRNPPTPGFGN
jgi:hypothetical protein